MEALLSVEELVRRLGDQKAIASFYREFVRRLETLQLVETYCRAGATVLDIGAQPFITSCALKKLGYRVVAFDIEPEPYIKIAETCGIDEVIKCDLEKDDLHVSGADCAVFTEVLEHLHYYYASAVLAKINLALKPSGHLILTTPNIAALFRRLILLLGRQPLNRYHVREYTMDEVLAMVRRAGFDVVKAYYSIVNEVSIIETELEDYLRISGFRELIMATVKKPTKLNVLRILTWPLVKLRPSLRQYIVVVGVKINEPEADKIERWGCE